MAIKKRGMQVFLSLHWRESRWRHRPTSLLWRWRFCCITLQNFSYWSRI